MAQRIDALKFRLGVNSFWLSQWHAKQNYPTICFEDHIIRLYLHNIFDLRGFYSKRCLIKRKSNKIFIFLEFYASKRQKYQIPRRYRIRKKRFGTVLKIRDIYSFLTHLLKKKFYISFKNMYVVNRVHRAYARRLRGLFSKHKRFKFTFNVVTIFNIVIRTRAGYYLAKILSNELTIVNYKKRDPKIWNFINFTRQLVEYIRGQNTSLHGIRIHLKGRFKGANRSRINRYVEGAVPFNTIRASIDYCREKAITVNGSFGVHVWLAYKSMQE
jgi:hypothetical protein